MKEKIEILIGIRANISELKDRYDKDFADFQAKNKDLIDTRAHLSENAADLESEIRESAIDGYDNDGKKEREFGIGIRVYKTIEYKEADALTWAKEHKVCLKLDKSKFEKMAKVEDFDFVIIDERPQATLPKEFKDIAIKVPAAEALLEADTADHYKDKE